MDKRIYREYVAILKEELQPAMGCTEPIAVAYCAALARQTLGALPETVEVLASANIIKNVKSVIVPNTNGLRGIAAAAAYSSAIRNTSPSAKTTRRVSSTTSNRISRIYRAEKSGNPDNWTYLPSRYSQQ